MPNRLKNIFQKTKIVATVGPACNTDPGLVSLVNAGVDVFRLNFSHSSHSEHKAVIDHTLCVNCGICKNACPFHAIAYIPVPCEDSCPVGAIE